MDYSYYKIAEGRENLELERLFKRFKSVNDYYFTTGNVCFDSVVNNNTLIEVKVRDVSDYVFNNYVIKEGAMLEKSKYDSLLRAKDDHKMKKVLYINIFKTQGKILIFDLDKIELTYSEKNCNRQTYAQDNTKIRKQLYLLDFKNALELNY